MAGFTVSGLARVVALAVVSLAAVAAGSLKSLAHKDVGSSKVLGDADVLFSAGSAVRAGCPASVV